MNDGIDMTAVRKALQDAAQSPESWWTDPACLVSITDEEPDEYDLLDESDKAQLAALMRL
jgi:hypothetical protein